MSLFDGGGAGGSIACLLRVVFPRFPNNPQCHSLQLQSSYTPVCSLHRFLCGPVGDGCQGVDIGSMMAKLF